jgi:hypothetical protein
MPALIEAAPELEVLSEMGDPWELAGHGTRLDAVRGGARALRERLLSGPSVVSARTFDLLTLGYPTRFGFWGAARVPSPYVMLRHRALLVQFRQRGELRNLLFNPTEIHQLPHAPYLANLRRRGGPLARLMLRLYEPPEVQLVRAGIRPEDIDYVAFDHFHLQDVRNLLSPHEGRPARFPRARLLASRPEWDDWDDLHPLHRPFFLAAGKRGVPEERVVLLDDDVQLGDGVMLLRTRGHTSGHQTLFFRTERGIWGVGENGVAADNWAPRSSRIHGVASRTEDQELEVLLNLNTPESGADQYVSMVLEKTLVDRVPGHEDFPQTYPSFEATPSHLTPGLRPFVHGPLSFGQLVRRGAPAPASEAPRSPYAPEPEGPSPTLH